MQKNTFLRAKSLQEVKNSFKIQLNRDIENISDEESSFLSNEKSQSLENSNHTSAIVDFLVQTGYTKNYAKLKKKDLAFYPEVFFRLVKPLIY